MTPPSHDLQFDLGAYVLGALTPAEREVIDAHLSSCPVCADEMTKMSRLPVLLDLLPEEEVAAMGSGGARPSDDLVDRVVAAALVERHGQRRRRWLVSSAAAVVLVAGSSAVAVAASSSSTPRDKGVSFEATDRASGAWADVDVHSRAWGASLDLKLTGVPAGEHCKLVVVGRDGTSDVAGSWVASYTGVATVTGATSMTLSSTASYDIVTFTGQKLLTVPTA